MPGMDGTGPMGRGAMTGRGFGFCTGVNAARYGAGLGLGLGLGLGFGYRRALRRSCVTGPIASKSQKELLTEQKELLQNRIDMISKLLDGLSEDDK